MNNIIRPHKVLENRNNGVQAIKLTESPYSGIIFNYGKVDFDEQGEHLKLHFEYDIIEDGGVVYNKEELEKYLGDMLVEFITYGLMKNEITYTGGVDENRTGDPIEPDSQ